MPEEYQKKSFEEFQFFDKYHKELLEESQENQFKKSQKT